MIQKIACQDGGTAGPGRADYQGIVIPGISPPPGAGYADGMTANALLAIPMRLACAAALFLLAGCWTGMPWLQPPDATPVLADGAYRLSSAEEPNVPGDLMTIARQPDGTLAIEGADNPLNAVIVPLDPLRAPHRHIVQLQRPDRPTKALFMLLDDSDGRYRLALLPCADRWAEAAEKSGGSIVRDPQAAATCRFLDKRALFDALAAASKEAVFDLELIREPQ